MSPSMEGSMGDAMSCKSTGCKPGGLRWAGGRTGLAVLLSRGTLARGLMFPGFVLAVAPIPCDWRCRIFVQARRVDVSCNQRCRQTDPATAFYDSLSLLGNSAEIFTASWAHQRYTVLQIQGGQDQRPGQKRVGGSSASEHRLRAGRSMGYSINTGYL